MVSLGSVVFVVNRLIHDRARTNSQLEEKAVLALDPVLREAMALRTTMGPLLSEVNNLRMAVVEGRAVSERDRMEYEARIQKLEALITKASTYIPQDLSVADVDK